jgi:hypothetical protein
MSYLLVWAVYRLLSAEVQRLSLLRLFSKRRIQLGTHNPDRIIYSCLHIPQAGTEQQLK